MLNAVFCIAAGHCVATGYYLSASGSHYTLIETDYGAGWWITSSPNDSSFQNNYLNGVSCTVAGLCVAVGYYHQNETGEHQALAETSVAVIPPTSAPGYYLVASDGGVFSFGDAKFYGSMGGKHLNAPIVGMASTGNGKGYWLVASDGGVFSFGDAKFYGTMVPTTPAAGIAADFSTGGYWFGTAVGGVWNFNAPFFGSMGGNPLNAPINKPIVGMVTDPATSGYWLVA